MLGKTYSKKANIKSFYEFNTSRMKVYVVNIVICPDKTLTRTLTLALALTTTNLNTILCTRPSLHCSIHSLNPFSYSGEGRLRLLKSH